MSKAQDFASFGRANFNWPGLYFFFGQFMSTADAAVDSGDEVPTQVFPGGTVTWEDDGKYVVTLTSPVAQVVGVFPQAGAGQEGVAMTLETQHITQESEDTVVQLHLYEEDAVSGIKVLSDTDNVPCWFVIVCSDQPAAGNLDSLLVEEEGVA